MTDSPQKSFLATEVTAELRQLQAVEPLLSAAARQTVTGRVQQWATMKQKSASTLSTKSQSGKVLLVMRPGLPPRPLDPFFFELK